MHFNGKKNRQFSDLKEYKKTIHYINTSSKTTTNT